MSPTLAIKIDVDTDRGTRIGVPNLLNLFTEFNVPATFLFSLGPDNTGRAIKRIFRPGFLKKVSRTSVVSTYGLRTLLNGVLLPGPHISRRNKPIMQKTRDLGHEVGIHCYDHIRWQDGLAKMNLHEVKTEFGKALHEFQTVFATPAKTAGAAGWQANYNSLIAYDEANLLYGSDGRGTEPFFPHTNNKTFKTLQIPTTLPTLDELVGRPEFPLETLHDHYFNLFHQTLPNIFTIHAEIEGMRYLSWFREFIKFALQKSIQFVTMENLACNLLKNQSNIPACEFIQGQIEGRSGTLAVQGSKVVTTAFI